MERAGLEGNLDISISKTDITKTENDAIVNSISKDYRFSGAIAKAIKKKCGDTICHECVANGQEKYEHGLSEGSVIRTGGGKSGFKAIYHIVLGSYKKNSTEQKIKEILLDLLEDANSTGIKSIGIPPFGTGGNHTPMKICVRAMVGALREYSMKYKNPKCKKINICIYEEKPYGDFQKEYNQLSNEEINDPDSDDDPKPEEKKTIKKPYMSSSSDSEDGDIKQSIKQTKKIQKKDSDDSSSEEVKNTTSKKKPVIDDSDSDDEDIQVKTKVNVNAKGKGVVPSSSDSDSDNNKGKAKQPQKNLRKISSSDSDDSSSAKKKDVKNPKKNQVLSSSDDSD